MAHRIETHDKQQGLSQAWHGLTEIVPEITLENNWLNQWDLIPRPLFFDDSKESGFSLLAVNDVPGLNIGAPYNPLTFTPVCNKDFLELVRASIAGTSHKIVSVASVRNRGRVSLSIELVGMEKFIAAGRYFSAYLNFGNGHDKSSVLWVNTSNTCTVCDNTFSANLFSVENKEASEASDDIKLRLRHTKNAKMRFPEIAKLIDKAVGVQGEFAVEFEKLSIVKIAEPTAEKLFAGFLGRNVTEVDKGMSTRARNTTSRLVQLYRGGAGNQGENLADCFSAITDYYTHFSSGGDNVMRQLVSSEYGSGQTNKADFWRMVRNPEMREKSIECGKSLLAHTKAD